MTVIARATELTASYMIKGSMIARQSALSKKFVRSISSAANPVNVNTFRSDTRRTFRSEFPIASPISTFSTTRSLSSSAAPIPSTNDENEPFGELWESPKGIRPDLIGKAAMIRRTFGPRSNGQAMLTCGGEALAAFASFDPDYSRAQGWIRHHAVGPAVLSPVLITGVVGALVEATFPQAVPVSQSMKQHRPLIVGVAVHAKIEVVQVVSSNNDEEGGTSRSRERGEEDRYDRRYGHQVDLKTTVARVRDDVVIAEGEHSVWIPDYQNM
jgi:acyl dehydratase